jgi:hypothetical protein
MTRQTLIRALAKGTKIALVGERLSQLNSNCSKENLYPKGRVKESLNKNY